MVIIAIPPFQKLKKPLEGAHFQTDGACLVWPAVPGFIIIKPGNIIVDHPGCNLFDILAVQGFKKQLSMIAVYLYGGRAAV